jgi:hypothetical protein
MSRFAVLAAVATFAIAFATPPANAEIYRAGKCWHPKDFFSPNGYWGDCVTPANIARAQRLLYRRQRDPHSDR